MLVYFRRLIKEFLRIISPSIGILIGLMSIDQVPRETGDEPFTPLSFARTFLVDYSARPYTGATGGWLALWCSYIAR